MLPDHAPLVVARSRNTIEQVGVALKLRSVYALLDAGLHPYQQITTKRPKVWARGGHHVFLSSDSDIRRSVANPAKHGFPPQRWSLITAYSG